MFMSRKILGENTLIAKLRKRKHLSATPKIASQKHRRLGSRGTKRDR